MSIFDYAPAPESRDIARLKPSYQIYVDGAFRDGSGESIKTINPADEVPLAEISEAGLSDVDDAVQAARRAAPKWAALPGRERGKYLFRIARAIQERGRELAVLESLDNGKPIRESRDVDVPTTAAHFFYYAGWADKLGYAGFGPDPKPIGVAGQIIPWNFPLLMAAWKIAPALACGNSVVLKPSEETPLSALLLAELLQEAELPAGVLNVVPGRGETAGARLAAHPDVAKIAFTGSTEVGKLTAKASAESNLKRVSLELGGKSPNIVFADADLTKAVSGVFFGIFFNQGQVCSAGSRLFVQEKVYDQALDQLVQTVKEARIGPGIDPVTQMGPLVSKTQMERVLGYIRTGSQEGARLLAGGHRPGEIGRASCRERG